MQAKYHPKRSASQKQSLIGRSRSLVAASVTRGDVLVLLTQEPGLMRDLPGRVASDVRPRVVLTGSAFRLPCKVRPSGAKAQ